jgi:hypothetical protein
MHLKNCMIRGDMESDSADEQYPTVSVCDECIEQDKQSGDESVIIQILNSDLPYETSCYFCGNDSD